MVISLWLLIIVHLLLWDRRCCLLVHQVLLIEKLLQLLLLLQVQARNLGQHAAERVIIRSNGLAWLLLVLLLLRWHELVGHVVRRDSHVVLSVVVVMSLTVAVRRRRLSEEILSGVFFVGRSVSLSMRLLFLIQVFGLLVVVLTIAVVLVPSLAGWLFSRACGGLLLELVEDVFKIDSDLLLLLRLLGS